MILYAGKYRSAAWYAGKLSALTNLPCRSIREYGQLNAHEPTVIICSLYAGGLYQSKKICRLLAEAGIRSFVLLTCGLSDPAVSYEDIEKAAKRAFSGYNFTLFALRGSIDYSKLSFKDRTMMAMLKKMTERQSADGLKGQDTEAFLETYGKKVFFESEIQLEPVLAFLNGLSQEKNICQSHLPDLPVDADK